MYTPTAYCVHIRIHIYIYLCTLQKLQIMAHFVPKCIAYVYIFYVYIFYTCISIFMFISSRAHRTADNGTGWWRRMRCLIYVGYFLRKSPVIDGSFANRWLFCGKRPAIKGIVCIFAILYSFCPRIRQWMSYMQIWTRANLYPYISIRAHRTAVKGRFCAESFGCGSHTYIFLHAIPCATAYPYVPYICIRINIYMYIHIYMYIYTYIYMYIHIYICATAYPYVPSDALTGLQLIADVVPNR